MTPRDFDELFLKIRQAICCRVTGKTMPLIKTLVDDVQLALEIGGTHAKKQWVHMMVKWLIETDILECVFIQEGFTTEGVWAVKQVAPPTTHYRSPRCQSQHAQSTARCHQRSGPST